MRGAVGRPGTYLISLPQQQEKQAAVVAVRQQQLEELGKVKVGLATGGGWEQEKQQQQVKFLAAGRKGGHRKDGRSQAEVGI